MIELNTRREDITEIIKKEELKSLKPENNYSIPSEVLKVTGEVHNTIYPKQGRCSLVVILKAEHGEFALKVAKGNYRGQELYREYNIVNKLRNTSVPVAEAVLFKKINNHYYYLSKYCEGEVLSSIFFNINVKELRAYIIKQMAEQLRLLHNISIKKFDYSSIIDNQLYFAEKHFNNNTIDIYDFIIDGVQLKPKDELEWLKLNKPKEGSVTLIHGDYRPKNMIYKNNKVEAILDWAFCNISDPYYDIVMLYDYFNEEEIEFFNKCYGLNNADKKRIEYQKRMIPFLNI